MPFISPKLAGVRFCLFSHPFLTLGLFLCILALLVSVAASRWGQGSWLGAHMWRGWGSEEAARVRAQGTHVERIRAARKALGLGLGGAHGEGRDGRILQRRVRAPNFTQIRNLTPPYWERQLLVVVRCQGIGVVIPKLNSTASKLQN